MREDRGSSALKNIGETVATWHCGLCDRVSKESACRCYRGKMMAWSQETLRPIVPQQRVDPRFAELLRQVASGNKSQEQAWQEWCKIRDAKGDPCELCDGHGGYAIVGSSGPGQVCPRCSGSGVQ